VSFKSHSFSKGNGLERSVTMQRDTSLHPNTILREMWFKPLDLSVTQAAIHLMVLRKTQSEVFNARAVLTPKMPMRLVLAFANGAHNWLGHQAAHDHLDIEPRRPTFDVARMVATAWG
jgi:antitoxin HigA-1